MKPSISNANYASQIQTARSFINENEVNNAHWRSFNVSKRF